MNDTELIKDTPYLVLTGKLSAGYETFYIGILEKNKRLCYKGSTVVCSGTEQII